jgi:hypothetical protein
MHRPGNVELPNPATFDSLIDDTIPLRMASVLFDSGALNGNYVSQSFVDKHIDLLTPFILPLDHSVMLGDSKTKVILKYVITLPLVFVDSSNKEHKATINCSIMHMTHLQMIVGLNTIIFSFFLIFFGDLLKHARSLVLKNHKTVSFTPDLSNITTIHPWRLPPTLYC